MEVDVETDSMSASNGFDGCTDMCIDVEYASDDAMSDVSHHSKGDDSSWARNGPASLQDVWSWARPMVQRAIGWARADGRSTMEKIMGDMCVFTDFSGVGFAESALSLVRAEFSAQTGLPSKVVFWRGSDVSKTCLLTLLVEGGPLHVFSDITRMIPVVHRELLYGIFGVHKKIF